MTQIGADGVYDIDITRYHHDPALCDGPSISASGLKQVAECPAKYWAFSPYNPNRLTPPESKAKNIGKAAHALVLGEPEFAAHFIISPHAEFRTNEAKAWRDAQTRTILKAEEFDTVRAMAEAQRKSPSVMQAFALDGKPEQSLIWKDAETGVWLRARPDWLPNDPAMAFLADYKTAVSIEPRKLSADVFKFGYHLQAAMQLDGVRGVMDIHRPLGIAHIVQEKTEPYLADLRMFQDEQLEYGRLIYRRALRTFADCMASGKWPAYTESPQYFSTPAWIARAMEEGIDDGDYGNGATEASGYDAADYYGAG